MVRKSKKGFTIVELVIVIAVIGILTAVLVPTFVNLVNKANQAADDSLVKNLNTQLRMKEQTEGKNRNLTEALEDAKEAGYLVENLTPKGSRDIVWNQDKDEFGFGDEAKGDLYKYWFIAKSEADLSKTFSKYLYFTPTSPIVVSTGVDVGTHENVDVSYVHSGTPAQKVVIRTNGGTLTINALNDTVTHYGNANVVDVKAVASQSYHEYGTSTFIKVDTGRVVVNDEAEVGGLYVESNDAIIAVESTAELPTVYYSDGVDSFKVQTTDGEGEKLTESDVTISGETVTTEASEGEQPVPVDVRVKIERSEQKTEEEAGEAAAESVPPVGVARIGTTGYASFNEAVAAAQPGQKIYLLEDCDVTETIGELAQEGPNAGQIVNGLNNEVVLSKDVTLKLIGLTYINLMPDGKFTMNEHTLKLGASTEGAGIVYADIDEILLTLLEESDYFAEINVDIDYQSENSFGSGNYIRFNGMRWQSSSMITGGGQEVFPCPTTTTSVKYFDSQELPRNNSEYKFHASPSSDNRINGSFLWLSPLPAFDLIDYSGAEITLDWKVEVLRGNLQMKVMNVYDVDAYAADTSNGFADQFASDDPITCIFGSRNNLAGMSNYGFGAGVMDILSGTGEVEITAKVTSYTSGGDWCWGDDIPVGTTYTFSVFVY